MAIDVDIRPNVNFGPLDRLDRSITGLTRGFGRLGTAIGLSLGGIGAAAVLTGITRTTARLEDLRTALDSVTGSARAGARAEEFIQEFAVRSQFSIEDLTTTFIKLRGAGIEPTEELLRSFSDTAAVTSDQIGTLTALTDLYSRTTAGGLGLEELNRLVDRGIPVYDILSERLGVSRLELSRLGMTAEGAQLIIQNLQAGLNERFGGSSERILENLSVSFSNLGIAATLFQRAIGEEFSETLGDIVNRMSSWLVENRRLAMTIGSDLNGALRFAGRALSGFGDAIAHVYLTIRENFDGLRLFVGFLAGRWVAVVAGTATRAVLTLAVSLSTSLVAAARSASTAILTLANRALVVLGQRLLGVALGGASALVRSLSVGLVNAARAAALAIVRTLLPALLSITGVVVGIVAAVALIAVSATVAFDETKKVIETFAVAAGSRLSLWGAQVELIWLNIRKFGIEAFNAVISFFADKIDDLLAPFRAINDYFELGFDIPEISFVGNVDETTDKIRRLEAEIMGLEYAADQSGEAFTLALGNLGEKLTESGKEAVNLALGLLGLEELSPFQDIADDTATATEMTEDLTKETLSLADALGAVREQRLKEGETLFGTEAVAQNFVRDLGNDFTELGGLSQEALGMVQEEYEKTGRGAEQLAKNQAASIAVTGQALKAGLEAAAQHSKRAFEINKALNIAIAITDGIAAVQAALKGPPGPPFSYAIAAATAAVTAANVASIQQQQYQGLATGGFVTNAGAFLVGERGPELVNLPRGSAVVNAQQTESALNSANQEDQQQGAIFENVIINPSVGFGRNAQTTADAVGGQVLESLAQGQIDRSGRTEFSRRRRV